MYHTYVHTASASASQIMHLCAMQVKVQLWLTTYVKNIMHVNKFICGLATIIIYSFNLIDFLMRSLNKFGIHIDTTNDYTDIYSGMDTDTETMHRYTCTHIHICN